MLIGNYHQTQETKYCENITKTFLLFHQMKRHNVLVLDIETGAYWPKMCIWQKTCLLNENVSIEWKSVYWLKNILLNKNVSIDRKGTYWKMKSHNYSVFLNVYVALIYVVVQWGAVNKKSNISAISYYIDID